ncbi:MAG: hypothetical protein KC621_01080 [Myxococcales bacterium]|nr:hypothetical protein [Myxococcales bacterium]
MWTWTLLTACHPTDGSSPTDTVPTDSVTTPTGDTGGATTTTPTGPELPPPDMPALKAALQAGVAWVPKMSLEACIDAWNVASADSSRRCPLYSEIGETTKWYGGCEDAGGVSYTGNMSYITRLDEFVQVYLWDRWFVDHATEVDPTWAGGSFTGTTEGLILSGTGWSYVGLEDTWLAVGEFQSITAVQDDVRLRWHALEGICVAEQPVGTWVNTLQPWLHIAQLSPEGSGTYRTWVDGTITGLTPDGYDTVSFDDLWMVDPAFGGCADEPTGAIEVRHEDGWVYRVVFGDTCDGCGIVEATGEEVCLDFTALRGAMAPTADYDPNLPDPL